MGCRFLGAVNLNFALNGSTTPWQKGPGKVTGAKKKLTVLVKLQMVSVPIAIRADLLQNTHQASPSWLVDSCGLSRVSGDDAEAITDIIF